MTRRNRFLIGLLSAAATLGTLYAFAGDARWHRNGWRSHRPLSRQACGAHNQPPVTPNIPLIYPTFQPTIMYHHHHRGPWRRPKYNVPVNIAEGDTAYEVSVYATGFSKESIKLSVADEALYITGTRNWGETQPPRFVRQEFPVKTFERVIALNGAVDTAAITARTEAGVLLITLPKTPEALRPAQEVKVA